MKRPGPDLDDVYRSRPADFVGTRNRVVARLRQAGRTREATEIARLRKPSPALWAVNRLGVEARAELADFLQAVERLQQRQLQGRPGLGEVTERQRQALDRLVRRAGAILAGAQLSASPAVLGRVSATLLGAAVDRDGRAALRAGRLDQERRAPGFEAFAGRRGTAPAPRPAAEAPRRRPREMGGPPPPEAERRTGAAREARRLAEQRARALTGQAARLERQAFRQQRAADAAANAVAILADRLRRAEARLAQSRQAAGDAARLAQGARREAEEATAEKERPR